MNDLISRQAAIDAVEFGITYAKAINKSTGEVKELFKEGNKALNEAVERLKELPSAQPFTAEQIQTMQELEFAQVEKAYELGKADRPTGFWHIDAGVGCFCSKCGFDIGNDFDFMEYVRFCPYCGARMESEE